MKRFWILLLALLFTGCAGQDLSMITPTTEEVVDETVGEFSVDSSITLCIDRQDSLNPFTLTTQMNSILIPLLYDGLYTLDEAFTPKELLADGVTWVDNSCTIHLKNGIVFNDGSAIEGHDVAYSLELAQSSPLYSQQVAGITLYDYTSSSITFLVAAKDELLPSLLTFPIVKEGTGTTDHPVGIGRYTVEGAVLKATDPTVTVQTVELINPPQGTGLSYALRSNMLDLYYLDYSTAEDFAVSALGEKVHTTNLLYLGVNQSRSIGNVEFRKLLYRLIDRGDIVHTAYKDRATTTYLPIHPTVNWAPSMEFNTSFKVADYEGEGIAGITYHEEKLYYWDGEINLDLVVNSGNSCHMDAATEIQRKLLQYDIVVNILAYPYNSYLYEIKEGGYDLYLGEVLLKNNMALDALIYAEGDLRYGMAENLELSTAYTRAKGDLSEMDNFLLRFNENPPFIPLLFRDGTAAISRDIPSGARFSLQNLLYNITDW